jgi:hypothetical protein
MEKLFVKGGDVYETKELVLRRKQEQRQGVH